MPLGLCNAITPLIRLISSILIYLINLGLYNYLTCVFYQNIFLFDRNIEFIG